MSHAKRHTGSGLPKPVSNKPKPPAKENDKQRPCLFCRQQHAVLLPVCDAKVNVDEVFCSEACAAAWALDHITQSNLMWCMKHKCWSTMNGVCKECDLAKTMAEICGHCKEKKEGEA